MLDKALAALLTAVCLAHAAAAQDLRLVDANGSPIPYVNAYAPAIATGTVSNVYGELELTPRMAAAEAEVPVLLSCVGYRDTLLSIGELRAPVRAELVLAAADYTLAEAEVSGEAIELGKARTLGLRKPESKVYAAFAEDLFSTTFVGEKAQDMFSEGDSVGSGTAAQKTNGSYEQELPVLAGTEFGNLMRAKRRWRLDRVGANFSPTYLECTYEVSVYAYRDGEPAERLNARRHFVKLAPSNEPSELIVDLADEPIYGEGNFLVVFEAVTEGLTEVPMLHARLALGRRKRITRFRRSDGTWRRALFGVVVAVWAEVREVG